MDEEKKEGKGFSGEGSVHTVAHCNRDRNHRHIWHGTRNLHACIHRTYCSGSRSSPWWGDLM